MRCLVAEHLGLEQQFLLLLQLSLHLDTLEQSVPAREAPAVGLQAVHVGEWHVGEPDKIEILKKDSRNMKGKREIMLKKTMGLRY